MTRGKRLLFDIAKLLVWTAGILLFFRAMGFLVGGNFQEFWVQIAGLSTLFIVFMADLLKRFRPPGEADNKPSMLPALPSGTDSASAMTIIKDESAMSENKPHVYIDKMLTVNHGTINQNTPGGTMNFGPVTYNQHFEAPQVSAEQAETESQPEAVEAIGDDETIDINGLVELSEKLKSPGVSRNTIDNILKKADIKPCATEKDGRTIRNLYPRKESQSAVTDYLADRDN